jgi:DNA-binding PadR family transcriptional regulator
MYKGGSMPISDEIYFLCMLHNIGMTAPEKSLTIEEISRWTAVEPAKAEENLNRLLKAKYVDVRIVSGVKRYFITADGIRKVLSMYS